VQQVARNLTIIFEKYEQKVLNELKAKKKLDGDVEKVNEGITELSMESVASSSTSHSQQHSLDAAEEIEVDYSSLKAATKKARNFSTTPI
jgi:response regulator of citrate/malate metabolism